MRSLYPHCPECGTAVPFGRTQWGLGKPFACKECGTPIVLPRQIALPMAALALYYTLRTGEGFLADIWLVGGLMALLLVASLILPKARRAGPTGKQAKLRVRPGQLRVR